MISIQHQTNAVVEVLLADRYNIFDNGGSIRASRPDMVLHRGRRSGGTLYNATFNNTPLPRALAPDEDVPFEAPN